MNVKKYLLALIVSVGFITSSASLWAADCPPDGSGAEGVNAWIAANCDGENGCENPATTCNGEFTIELLDVTIVGPLVTFEYEVCQIGGKSALSHWGIGLGQIDCLGEGFSGNDLVFGATFNGEEIPFTVGLDPTTQLYQVKIDLPGGAAVCNTYSFTFDTSVLDEGYTLGVGCVPASTKAGPQDIRSDDRDSPGYACVPGPVCQLAEECWEGETAWASGKRYVAKGNWATYTAYVSGGSVTLYAGQTHVAGTVSFSAPVNGWVTITIELFDGFRFDESKIENVKIQDYAAAPSGNPNPGGFDWKGTAAGQSFEIDVPLNNFYGVHVDVERLVDCPDEPEED